VGSQENLADVAQFWNIEADAIRGSNPGLALTNQEVVGGMILLIPFACPACPEITTSEGNLTFGFQSNAILPPPLATAGDDASGVANPMSVFVDVPRRRPPPRPRRPG
jgi:hypothetical protein